MHYSTTSRFDKSYRRRNEKLRVTIKARIHLFLENPSHPLLRDHPLTGALQGTRSFSVTGDLRIHYEYISDNEVLLIDLGTHSELYD